jgi:hypothetical protein
MRFFFIAALLFLASLLPSQGGDTTVPPDISASPTDAAVESTAAPANLKTGYEFDADGSYVGSARTNFGTGSPGSVSEQRTNARLIVSPQWNDGPIYRFGLAYQRYGFGFSKAAPLPDILEAGNLVLGADFEIFNSWLVRVEADPGLYGDGRSLGYRDFNVPITLGGSYIASEEVQWALGFGFDINRQIPVIPAVGVRWAVNDNWVIDAILPTPRIEYGWSKALTLYVGSDIDDGTYRMDRGLGVALGRPKLSGAIVEYDEIRLGAGFTWKATKAITFELEGGYLPYREFDYHRADTHFSNDDGAPYGQMSINAQF